jgi:hypothetical protein
MPSEASSQSQDTIEKWPLPFNISLEKLDMIVKAFFQGGADSTALSVNDLAGRTGLNKNTISINAKFLEAVNILKTENGHDYLFGEKGAEYAKALSTSDDALSATTLQEILIESPLTELVDYVNLNKSSGLDYDTLFLHIKGMARIKDNPKYKHGVAAPYSSGISALIGLLIRANLIPQEILSQKKGTRKGTVKVPKPKSNENVQAITQKPQSTLSSPTIKQRFQARIANLPCTINISVEAKDPESIRELINLLKELQPTSSK